MEQKPALVNKQKVVYHFQCDQCETGYVGYTSRHLHQRVDEHAGKTAIGNHMRTHGSDISSLPKNFRILKKCKNKWDCLMFEMFFYKRPEVHFKQTKRFNSLEGVLNILFTSLHSVLFYFFH